MAESNEHRTNQSPPNNDESNNVITRTQCVRRRLDFSTEEVDEDLIQKFQSENRDKERQKGLEKWNFDFENEVPLTGDWQWEKVTPAENVPNPTGVMLSTKDKSKENRNV